MQPGARQNPRDAHLPHGREKRFGLLHQVAHEVREFVHRLGHPHQRRTTLFVNSPLPRPHRLLVEQEDPRRLPARQALSPLSCRIRSRSIAV
jgi:hypothetical protein